MRTPPLNCQLLIRLRRKCFGCHSERSEESLPLQKPKTKRDSSRKVGAQNDIVPLFFAACKVALKTECLRRG